jgi:hypothetical protein
MTPPVPQPIPRFIGDSPQEALPYGRWAEMLAGHFREACKGMDDLPEGAGTPEEIDWFPERGWGGRFYVPAAARLRDGETELECFGHVSFTREGDNGPTDFRATADFTDVLAEDNADWKIDLNDDVIGEWRADAGRRGDVTLVWGRPLVPGADAATAEVKGETLDQTPVPEERFTLLAVDAIEEFGDKLYLQVKLWNQRGQELASESLYDEGGD